jgi:hypothetical protein
LGEENDFYALGEENDFYFSTLINKPKRLLILHKRE